MPRQVVTGEEKSNKKKEKEFRDGEGELGE